MADTAEALLREMVETLGETPYQALDTSGPYACVFCGEETLDVAKPQHNARCIWPRVLKLFQTLH
jgi:peptide methionine sulfoxide reductase MsrB